MSAKKAANVAILFQRIKLALPKLAYGYKAFEPIISGEIMELHHSKLHQGYINKLNAAQEQLATAQAKNDQSRITSLAPVLRFNGGGHINHSILWNNLSPTKTKPSEELVCAIEKRFSSLDNFKMELSAAALAVEGSGWGWLGYNKNSKTLEIASVANQDLLEASTGLVPLFGIDVWEHAYYLQYKNKRSLYVEAIWEIANWTDISERFAVASR